MAVGSILGRRGDRLLKLAPTLLYLLALGIKVFSVGWGHMLSKTCLAPISNRIIEDFSDYLIALLICALVVDIFLNGLKKRRLAFGIIGGLLSLLIYSRAKDQSVFLLFWLIFSFPSQCKLRHVARTVWVTGYLTILLVVVFHLHGDIPELVLYEHGVLRHSWGYGSPNHLAVLSASFSLIMLYDLSQKWNWWYLPPALLIFAIVFSATNGRSSLVLCLVYLLYIVASNLNLLSGNIKRAFDRIVFFTSEWTFPFIALLCLIVTWMWSVTDGGFSYDFFNSAFSSRPLEMVSFFQRYGFKLVGQEMVTVSRDQALSTGEEMDILDNSYTTFAIRYGLIALVAFCILFSCLMKKCRKTGNASLSFYFILIAIFSITENVALDPVRNLTLLGIGAMISNTDCLIFSKERVSRTKHLDKITNTKPFIMAARIAHFAISALCILALLAIVFVGYPYLTKPQPKSSLSDYAWAELHVIAEMISSATNDSEAIQIAARFNLCQEDGSISSENIKSVKLTNGKSNGVRIIGFRHDRKYDEASRMAGITFCFTEPVTAHLYNESENIGSGWEDSSLRAYMMSDSFKKILPYELRWEVVAVSKSSYMKNVAEEGDSMMESKSRFWLLSPVEYFGEGSQEGSYSDAAIGDSGGFQYQYFSQWDAEIYRGSKIWTRSTCYENQEMTWAVSSSQLEQVSQIEKLSILPAFCY